MESSKMFTLTYPPKITFGPGVAEQVGAEARRYGRRALLVTGRSAMRKSGLLGRVLGWLEAAGLKVELFEQVESEPSLRTVHAGVEQARAEGTEVVVGVGGGSALDAAKAIAVMATQEGTIWEYHAGREIEREGLPFLALPTTAGTGAEITRNAVLTNEETRVKQSIRSSRMMARVALVDPELTFSLPPDVTAYTGMDAFTQAVEAFVTRSANPVTDALALEAVRRLFRHLPTAVADGRNAAAREEVALGSLLSALAFSNSGLGAVHGLAHPIGARCGVPHGLVCAVLLPHVMAFNLDAAPEKFARLAEALGVAGPEEGVGAVRDLLARLGLPMTLSDYGLAEADWSLILAESRSSSMQKNPREASDEDLTEILRRVS